MIGGGIEAKTAPNFPAYPCVLTNIYGMKAWEREYHEEHTKYGKEDHESSRYLHNPSASNTCKS